MTELHDLSDADQAQLMKEITAARCALSPRSSRSRSNGPCVTSCRPWLGLPWRTNGNPASAPSRAMQKAFSPKKVNVGMLGNMCAQYVPTAAAGRCCPLCLLYCTRLHAEGW